MNGGEPVSEVQQAGVPLLCASGPHPLGSRYHTNWDPRGRICQDCWEAQVEELRRGEWSLMLAEWYDEMKEVMTEREYERFLAARECRG